MLLLGLFGVDEGAAVLAGILLSLLVTVPNLQLTHLDNRNACIVARAW